MAEEKIAFTKDQFSELIAAIKAPTLTEQKKLDEEKRAMELREKMRVEMAQIEMEQKKNAQLMCGHHNGRHPTISGQRLTSGDFTAQCTRCQTTWAWDAIKANTPEGYQISQEILNFAPGRAEQHFERLEKLYPPRRPAQRYKEEK